MGELTHKVFAGFNDDFARIGLGGSLDVLLDERINAFAAISAVANLDGVMMVAQMTLALAQPCFLFKSFLYVHSRGPI